MILVHFHDRRKILQVFQSFTHLQIRLYFINFCSLSISFCYWGKKILRPSLSLLRTWIWYGRGGPVTFIVRTIKNERRTVNWMEFASDASLYNLRFRLVLSLKPCKFSFEQSFCATNVFVIIQPRKFKKRIGNGGQTQFIVWEHVLKSRIIVKIYY